MALGFGSALRLERLLLKTRHILGEGDDTLNAQNKVQALQLAASFYNLYGGDGSETTYADAAGTTVLQAEMIATRAAIELTLSAISYYKDDVVSVNGGPASASFRADKLAWLRFFLEELEKKLDDLEGASDILPEDLVVGDFALEKVRACCDPPEDVCAEDGIWGTNFVSKAGAP